MKALSNNGLTKLLNLIKDNFIKNTDVTVTSTIEVYTKSESDNLLNNKQNKLTSDNAGDNITITDESGVVKISSTGGSGSIAESVKDQNNTSNGIKTWTGTLAQYEDLKEKESWYGWGDYFTKSETPSVGDKIYNSDKTDSGKVITAIGDGTISYEE